MNALFAGAALLAMTATVQADDLPKNNQMYESFLGGTPVPVGGSWAVIAVDKTSHDEKADTDYAIIKDHTYDDQMDCAKDMLATYAKAGGPTNSKFLMYCVFIPGVKPTCQIASNHDPHFASNRDPSGVGSGLSR